MLPACEDMDAFRLKARFRSKSSQFYLFCESFKGTLVLASQIFRGLQHVDLHRRHYLPEFPSRLYSDRKQYRVLAVLIAVLEWHTRCYGF